MSMNSPLPGLDRARIAVIGLGYVGLPLAAAFGKHFPTVGFDITQMLEAPVGRADAFGVGKVENPTGR